MPRKRPAHRNQQHHKKELSNNSHLPNETDPGERQNGLVIARFGAKLDVENEQGQVCRCTSRRKFGAIVCGDRIVWEPTYDNEGVIVELLKRDTLLSRPDDVGRDKPIAANINQLIVVASAKGRTNDSYHINHNLIDRYLVAAESLDIKPTLIFNKTDLLNESELAQLKSDTSLYKEIGYQVMYTNTKQQHGLDNLIEHLKQGISVFVGESGVGKSSIISVLLPELDIRVGEVSSSSGKGKHTTTTAMLYHLTTGGDLIDSPGVRDFGFNKIEREVLAYSFIEFRPHISLCKFNNCSHTVEPNCAIIDAVNNEKISKVRYQNYKQILASSQN